MPRKMVLRIKRLLAEGRFRYSLHCAVNAAERSVTYADIRQVGHTAQSAKLQQNGTYKLIGLDAQKLQLTVICRLISMRDVLIVTVY